MTPENPSPDAKRALPPGREQPPAPSQQGGAQPAKAVPKPPQPAKPLPPGSPAQAQAPARRQNRQIILRICLLAAAVAITFVGLAYMNIFGRLFAQYLLGPLRMENVKIHPGKTTPPPPRTDPHSAPAPLPARIPQPVETPSPVPGADIPSGLPSPTPIPIWHGPFGIGQGGSNGEGEGGSWGVGQIKNKAGQH